MFVSMIHESLIKKGLPLYYFLSKEAESMQNKIIFTQLENKKIFKLEYCMTKYYTHHLNCLWDEFLYIYKKLDIEKFKKI